MNEFEAMKQVQKYLESRIEMLGRIKGGSCRDALKRSQECSMILEIVEKHLPGAEGFQDDKARKQVEAASKKMAQEHATKQNAEQKAPENELPDTGIREDI